jgi:hypothetical protein
MLSTRMKMRRYGGISKGLTIRQKTWSVDSHMTGSMKGLLDGYKPLQASVCQPGCSVEIVKEALTDRWGR